MSNQVIGTILAISRQETMQSKSGTQFVKQSVYLDNSRYDQETGEKYENNLLLEFINPKDGDIAQRFKKGDKVQISFRLRGYSFDSTKNAGKKEYGVSVSCYRIEPFQPQNNGYQQNTQQAPQQTSQPVYNAPQPTPQPQQAQAADPTESDLPF